MDGDRDIAALLQHPALWRGRSAAPTEVIATGFAALDAALPGGGWPRTGLIELLSPRTGIGELALLLPALAHASRAQVPRWCLWIAGPDATGTPLLPFAPALAAAGICLERVLVVRKPSAWAFEQGLKSGACEIALAWVGSLRPAEIRRLQLAAERGRTLGVLFRPATAAIEASPAILRLLVEPHPEGVQLHLLKSRGGARGRLLLPLPGSGTGAGP